MFEKREGATILTTYQGCGILVGEMKAGSRPDAYFSCDASCMEQVSGLFPDRANVAKTDIVLLVQQDNPKNIRGLDDLIPNGKTFRAKLQIHSSQSRSVRKEIINGFSRRPLRLCEGIFIPVSF